MIIWFVTIVLLFSDYNREEVYRRNRGGIDKKKKKKERIRRDKGGERKDKG